MRKHTWRMAAAAVVGTVALASAAIAQVPAPMPGTVQPLAPVPAAQAEPAAEPAPAPTVQAAPAVVAPAPAIGGCCAPGVAAAPSNGKKWADHLFIGSGTANPVGCGCLASERTFLWGGCKQFFTPGRTCDGSPMLFNRCGGHGHCGGLLGGKLGGGLFGGRERCPPPPYAAPYGVPADNCIGPFTYLDR